MLRWKSRYLPLLVSVMLIAAAAANAAGHPFNLSW